jgi:UDP-N-acetylglucosamine 2-epimerase (non-hydrolysing)
MFLVLIGTKAQLIKMAPVMRAMTRAKLPYRFVLTGQHQETMVELIEQFELPEPDYLIPLNESDTKTKLVMWVFRALWRSVFSKTLWRDVRYCLVHGDTMSTLMGALSARIRGRNVIHVEAGLRSYNLRHPFPEELIRICVTRLSHYFYCADQWAVDNVHAMVKRPKENVVLIGHNTLRDALAFAIESNQSDGSQNLPEPYCVVSVHRYENLSDSSRFERIMLWVERFAQQRNVKVVLHPATRKTLINTGWYGRLEKNPKISLLSRMGYCEFIGLLSYADFLASDGGSNQEECSYMNLPCLLFRDATERQEGLGEYVVLSKLDDGEISAFLNKFSKDKCASLKRELPSLTEAEPASSRIIDHLSRLEQ